MDNVETYGKLPLGFAETTAIARNFATQDRASWSPDREFLAQGVANVASRLDAGMPVDGSLSRSSLNHLSGARTRWSGVAIGVAVFAFLPLSGVLSALPKAVLAGVVIAAVGGLVRPRLLLRVWSLSRIQALVVWFTLALCLLLAPRVEQALLLGILLSRHPRVARAARPGSPAGWAGGRYTSRCRAFCGSRRRPGSRRR